LLRTPLKDREDADAEIRRLDTLLKEQKARRQEILDTVNHHNIILSPLRRLPPDVLHEIFWHCLPTHRNSIMASSEAPLLLTQICSSWRSIAFASPRIWSKLHIPLLGDPNISAGYGAILDEGVRSRRREIFAQLMRSRCAIAREWLSRSGTCLLSLSITYPGYYSTFGIRRDKDQKQELFDLLVSLAHRWYEIDVSMPMDVYDHFQSTLLGKVLPVLQVFKANLYERYRTDSTTNPTPIELLGAPNLRRIDINSVLITLNPCANPVQPIWSNLTYIDLLSSTLDECFLDLLRRCPNLVHGRFSIVSSWPEGSIVDLTQQQPVSLPRLKWLSISDSGHACVMASTFKLIQAPSLTSFEYQWSKGNHTPMWGEDTTPFPSPAPVLHFLEGSPPLEKLVLDGLLSSQNFYEVLRLSPQVTHLIISKSRMPSTGLAPPFLYPADFNADPDYMRPDDIDLNILSNSGPTFSGLDTAEENLIPKLEILEAYDICSFADEGVLRLIASRTGPSRRTGVAQLKRVRIHFTRQKQLDITGEVSQLAQAAGIDLRLDLFYPPVGPEQNDRLSASYGLTMDDRMWSSEIP